jgi:oxalate decarboxylase
VDAASDGTRARYLQKYRRREHAPQRRWCSRAALAQSRGVGLYALRQRADHGHDAEGRNFVDDVGVGDLWYFASGVPHSIQGLNPDGAEFLLVFDDGDFDEDNTFLISDWFKHTPNDVLAKNFGVSAAFFGRTPDPGERYIFPVQVPGSLDSDKIPGATAVPQSLSHRMLEQQSIKTKNGTVRITDSSVFPASKNIAAALVEVEPGGMREMHWHPNTDEWQYYIEGQARMSVFAAAGQARTFDFMAGDVGYVPFAMGHYIENTGNTRLRFLEIFKSSITPTCR